MNKKYQWCITSFKEERKQWILKILPYSLSFIALILDLAGYILSCNFILVEKRSTFFVVQYKKNEHFCGCSKRNNLNNENSTNQAERVKEKKESYSLDSTFLFSL